MSDEIHEIADIQAKPEIPWKKIMLALVTGATTAGAAYMLAKKIQVPAETSDDPQETTEA